MSLLRDLIHRSRLLSKIGALFNRSFDREIQSVAAGQSHYWKRVASPTQSSPLLRRNIHRLEKGLSMPDGKPVFAEDFIEETVEQYQKCCESDLCSDERQWAKDVLIQYFRKVQDTPIIATARARFQGGEEGNMVPYARATVPLSKISYEELLVLCQQRRSVRWFKQEPVDVNLIRRAIDLASLAPSACNRQPFQFFISDKPDVATDIARLAMGTKGFAENIPCLIAVVGDLSYYAEYRDRHIIYIDGSLATMQLMLALETLGLSSCPINWPDIEKREAKMAKRLKLAAHQRVVMLVAIGKADPSGLIPYSQKKSHQQLMKPIE